MRAEGVYRYADHKQSAGRGHAHEYRLPLLSVLARKGDVFNLRKPCGELPERRRELLNDCRVRGLIDGRNLSFVTAVRWDWPCRRRHWLPVREAAAFAQQLL